MQYRDDAIRQKWDAIVQATGGRTATATARDEHIRSVARDMIRERLAEAVTEGIRRGLARPVSRMERLTRVEAAWRQQGEQQDERRAFWQRFQAAQPPTCGPFHYIHDPEFGTIAVPAHH